MLAQCQHIMRPAPDLFKLRIGTPVTSAVGHVHINSGFSMLFHYQVRSLDKTDQQTDRQTGVQDLLCGLLGRLHKNSAHYLIMYSHMRKDIFQVWNLGYVVIRDIFNIILDWMLLRNNSSKGKLNWFCFSTFSFVFIPAVVQ